MYLENLKYCIVAFTCGLVAKMYGDYMIMKNQQNLNQIFYWNY